MCPVKLEDTELFWSKALRGTKRDILHHYIIVSLSKTLHPPCLSVKHACVIGETVAQIRSHTSAISLRAAVVNTLRPDEQHKDEPTSKQTKLQPSQQASEDNIRANANKEPPVDQGPVLGRDQDESGG